MFHSIRWRLVISYVLLTLLTVSMVGVLTLSLARRYVEQQVGAELRANAESVARQAAPLMWPVPQPTALRELARTSAFLGDVRVRILDDRRRLMVDSGTSTGVDRVMWLAPRVELDLGALDQSWIMVMPQESHVSLRSTRDFPFLQQLPADMHLTLVSRTSGVWGSRFTFEGRLETQMLSLIPEDGNAVPVQKSPDDVAAQRSGQVVTAYIGAPDDPFGYVELSSAPDFGAQALATTRRAFLLAAGGAMLCAVLVGLLVSHGLTAPLRGLATAAGRMSDDLSTRAPVRGQDEIGQLALQLNQMAERLQDSFTALTADRDALRRFIADASHELRTPITALRNFNELLQNGAADDPAARDEFLTESAVQLERLEWITKNLLDLSRLDAGLAALELDPHDAGELLQATCAAFKSLAAEKDVALSVSLPASPVKLLCDAARIQLALSNLLDNALKFTPAGGRVQVGTEAEGENVRLWVQDDGPGVDPADLPHIFERFYRGRGNRSEGNGLGLAIVRSVVRAHGGQVEVQSEPEAGSRFVIELPRDKD